MSLRGALVGAVAFAAGPALAAPTLAPVWSDHAVVQRDRPIVVEGEAAPGAQLEISLGAEHARARADAEGRFSATLAPRPASAAPVTLSVSDGAGTAVASDIVVGEVWLCSGQSNMELPVARALDSANQIAASTDPQLRLLQVPKHTAPAPAAAFGSQAGWEPANPASVQGFSAACFYMAQALRRELGVPVGAIHASWGGSQVRAWLTPEGGRALYGEQAMALLSLAQTDMPAAVAGFAPVWEEWWRAGTGGEQPWIAPERLSWSPVPAIAPWTTWRGTPLADNPTGTVLLRRTIDLTAAQAAAGGTLRIGIIDDLDMTWVNGHPVGNTHGWSTERHYPVPAAFLKPGANEVLVAASNSWAEGGFQSPPATLAFEVSGGRTIPLADGWLYAIGSISEMPPRAPWDANAGIGVMHNRMVAPLGSIALRGVAWYQGESDVGIPGYAARLAQLFAGWRRQFGPLRVLVVQLPGFGPRAEGPTESGWAAVREQQRAAAAADADATLIATLDIGDPADLHPPDKNELGRRLARAATGEALPMPDRAVRKVGEIRVGFVGVAKGLHSWSGAPLGLELCAERQESCRFASARVDGDALVLTDDGRPATRVRYAWAESPLVNVFDGRGLPLPGFEIPILP